MVKSEDEKSSGDRKHVKTGAVESRVEVVELEWGGISG